MMFLLSALVLAAADSEAAAGPVASFRCNKAAFYPTAGAFKDKAGGTRHVLLPEAMCASVATDHEVMQALCCANTRVNCSTAVTTPTLVSYDGSHYALKNEQSREPSTAATVLADADRRLCSMMMADKCSDCDRSKCSLFSKAPAAKSCYGRTYVDKPDGSGWLKKDAALSEKLEAQLAANQSHLYFYWVNNGRQPACGEVDAAPFMPKDLFEPSHKLALLGYIEAAISLFGVKGGPQPGDLKLGRCKDHGFVHAYPYDEPYHTIWTPMDLQGPICMKRCKCQWWDTHTLPVSGYKPAAAAGLHNCTDVPDDPATGHFCSLCGPSAPGNCGGETGKPCGIGITIWHNTTLVVE
jgi:hypothetical protein